MDDELMIKRLYELLDAKQWTPYRLSKEADIPNSTINSIFQRKACPSIHTLSRICKALRITLSEFFDYDKVPLRHGDMTPDEQKLLTGFQNLPQKKKPLLLAYLQGLKSN